MGGWITCVGLCVLVVWVAGCRLETSGLGSDGGTLDAGRGSVRDARMVADAAEGVDAPAGPSDASTDAARDATVDVVTDAASDAGRDDAGSARQPLGASCSVDGDCESGHCEKEIDASFTTLICCRVDCSGADELHEGCFSDGSGCEF